MGENAFSPIATIRLPAGSRIFPSSWCPDKDLLLIVSRSPSGDKLSLWKMQGSKKWEFEFDKASTTTGGIVDVAWSPDGTVIAVAHHPATITLHSVQDGSQHGILFPRIQPGLPERPNLCGIWWFKRREEEKQKSIPDILKRNNVIPGSALSVLRSQPLLDALYDETHAMSTSDLFSFQSSNPRNPPRYITPQAVQNWPSLPSDLPAASLRSKKAAKQKQRPGEELDQTEDPNINTLLIAADRSGNIWTYLDGSYPLGFVSLGLACSVISLDTDQDAALRVYPQAVSEEQTRTAVRPFVVQLPLLKQRLPRDVAKLSTAAKDLTYFALCVVKEMRIAWFGSETHSGAREWGERWLKTLETRQKEQFGVSEPNAILDLTALLATGRASESLADYLGSGEQMSERGIQKWESAILEALVRLRDYSEKLLTPATQRLYILFTDVRGWAVLPQFADCHLKVSEVEGLMALLSRGIVCASWLAATARKEFVRFIEFITWLRHETSKVNQQGDPHNQTAPRHDILEVNEYLMSGLVNSAIDRWFTGATPNFEAKDLGMPDDPNIETYLETMREILQHPNGLAAVNVKPVDLTKMDRNLDALYNDFSTQCRRMFNQACQATSRSAVVLPGPNPLLSDTPRPLDGLPMFSRQRNRTNNDMTTQYLAIQSPRVQGQSHLCLVQLSYDQQVPPNLTIASAVLLHCAIEQDGEITTMELMGVEFFDEEILIVVYRVQGNNGAAYMGTVDYANLDYERIDGSWDVNCDTRESLMVDLLRRLEHGQLTSSRIPVVQSRVLEGCREGKVSLAVNGRLGRRVACVLDKTGSMLEILDMEGEAEEDVDGGDDEDGDESEREGNGFGRGGGGLGEGEEVEDSMDATID